MSKFIGEKKFSLRFWGESVNFSLFFLETGRYLKLYFLTPRGYNNQLFIKETSLWLGRFSYRLTMVLGKGLVVSAQLYIG